MRKILRSLGAWVSEIVHNVAPQVHSPGIHLHILPELDNGNVSDYGPLTRAIRGNTTEPFLTTSDSSDTGSLIESTSAAIVASWSTFSESGQEIIENLKASSVLLFSS